MKKELLEKIKRVMEKVSEKLMGTWAFSYCKDTVNVLSLIHISNILLYGVEIELPF